MLRNQMPLIWNIAVFFACSANLSAADVIWIEGEEPTAIPAQAKAEGAERSQFLSGGKWLMAGIDAEKVDASVPGAGVDISYKFECPAAGKREIWARIGFEFARSPFQWRIDGKEWTEVKPDVLTSDQMELGTWCEVAWLRLTDADLVAGAHSLDIQILKSNDGKGKPQRLLFGIDAICIAGPGFQPNGKFKPGEEWREEADRKAGDQVFQLSEPAKDAAQANLDLSGTWEICRDDESMPLADPATPIAALPQHPIWRAIAVPGDKNILRPDMLFAHRVWYRTRVKVPEAWKGGSFHLVFPANNLNTTVWVNGVSCGFNKNPLATVKFDITKAIKPGNNELYVGIRDAWYGRKWDPKDPMKLRRTFNLPASYLSNGFQELSYPIWNMAHSGILVTPRLVAGGPVYTEDAFCISSVQKKELTVELTLHNPGESEQAGEAICEAVNDATGTTEMTSKAVSFTAKAGGDTVLRIVSPWADAKLWWPDEPNLYRLRTMLKINGKPVDVQETTFGFREWTADGVNFKLNGVRWQGFSEMAMQPPTIEQWLATYRKNHYNFFRMWPHHVNWGGGTNWYRMEPEKALSFFDRNGIVVRRSGYLDGEVIGYLPVESDNDKKNVIRQELMDNWRDHLVAWIKGERNHPSVMIWSIENEFLFINCLNLYADLMDKFEAEVTKASDAVRAADPTRFVMVDGGGATKANTLPVHGDHYPCNPDLGRYPALAYEANAEGGGRGRWKWDEKRPRFIGEDCLTGETRSAYFGGEQVFLGKSSGYRLGVGIAHHILSEGYRWYGIGAVDLCQGPSDSDGRQYDSWLPQVVLCRQWDWTFASWQKAKRTFGIFNSTRFTDPLAFTRTLTMGGKQIWTRSTDHTVPPGGEEKFDEELAFPETTTRLEGELVLTLAVKGKEVFRATKAVSVLPAAPTQAKPPEISALKAEDLFVYDPAGGAAAFLTARGIPFTAQDKLAPPPMPGKIWLVGKDALGKADADSTIFTAYAVDGGKVLLLEQANPLRYQAIAPAEMEVETNEGRVAFGEDFSHPILAGLANKDFFTWEPGEVVWKNAYRKPSHGAKSLIQCNKSLISCALAVAPIGKGVLVISQLVIEEKLQQHVVPQQLMTNMLSFAASYKLEFVPVAACAEPGLVKVLDEIGLQRATASDPVAAMGKGKVVVVSATPGNLKLLADAQAEIDRFTQQGGQLVLHGLTPDGLADFNRLVGYEHLIRPFRRERVTFAPVRDLLTAGVTLTDVALYSGEQIFPWVTGNYVASDTFSFIVDLEDVAPFAKLNNEFYYNLVNGMVSADAWKYICNHADTDREYIFTLPRAEEITEITWIGNTFYNPTRRIEVIADGDEAGKRTFDVAPNNEPQTLKVEPALKGTKITVRHALFDNLPDKKHLIGCDNISLIAKRPDGFREKVKPMLNIGGMVNYPRGKGGIVLCNLLFKDTESPAVSGIRKRGILTTILSNMKAPFSGGKTVIAGANIEYFPLDLSKQANQYRTDRGWFGDPKKTLKDIPIGEQVFAGVKFVVYDFPTSPVPTVISLGGKDVPNNLPDEVKGIPINRKADALFFLHTARIDTRMNDKDRKEGKRYEMARYVVTWADGKTETIPIYAEIDIDDWRQKQPSALPGAQLAWSGQYEGAKESATVWHKQWTNSRPDVDIKSVDLVYGQDKRGVPVLIALTAAMVHGGQ